MHIARTKVKMSFNSSLNNVSKEISRRDENEIPFIRHFIGLLILCLGIIANALLIFAHYRDPLHVFRNTTSLFIRNIAIIDICVAILWSTRIVRQLLQQNPEIISLIWVGFTALSPLALLCLAIERFLSVAYPFWYRVKVTIKSSFKFIIGTWIAHTTIFVFCYVIINPKANIFIMYYVSVLFLFVYVVYFATYLALRRQRYELQKTQDPNEGALNAMKVRQKHEKRFLVTIAIVCFTLAIVYIPILVFTAIKILLEMEKIREIYSALLILLNLNVLLNPIVYLLRLPKYRKTFKVLYCNFL